jgi:fibronectin type 3 domain-containing protein
VPTAKVSDKGIALRWTKVERALRYDVYRSVAGGPAALIESTKVASWTDAVVLGGQRYEYFVRAVLPDGLASEASPRVGVDLPLPDYMLVA